MANRVYSVLGDEQNGLGPIRYKSLRVTDKSDREYMDIHRVEFLDEAEPLQVVLSTRQKDENGQLKRDSNGYWVEWSFVVPADGLIVHLS